MSGLRARLRTPDPLLGVVAVVSLVVYVLRGFDGVLSRDLGVYTYGGQRFLAGDPPYVGIMNRAGPLAHVLPGVGIGLGRLVGVADVHAARGFFLLLAIASVVVVHVVVRDLSASRAAGVVGAVTMLTFQGFTEMATNGPREKTAMVLFLLVSLWALVHRRWATCGVFVALATLTWQPVFVVALPAALVAALLAPEHRLRALLRIALGGAVTTGVVLVYYVANGALHAFLEGFVLVNAKYTKQGAGTQLSETWHILQTGYGSSVWVILAGLVALPVVAVLALRPAWRTREPAPVALAALGVGWLAGVAWTARVFNGWPDVFVLLPLSAIGLGCAVGLVLRRLELRLAVPVALVLAVTGTVYAAACAETSRGHGLTVQEASVAAVLRAGPPHATMLSVQAPQAMALARRVNPTTYQMFGNGFSQYVDDTYPGGLRGYADWIAQHQPTYVVMQTNLHPKWLMPTLEGHYRKVAGAPGFSWWVSTTVPQDVQDRIHAANVAAVERADP